MNQIDVYFEQIFKNHAVAVFFATTAKIIFLAILGFAAELTTRKTVLKAFHKVINKSRNRWDDQLVEKKILSTLCHLVPALLVYALANMVFGTNNQIAEILRKATHIYVIVVVTMVLTRLADAVCGIYDGFEVSRTKPVKGYVQALKIVLFIMAGVFTASVLLNKSPWGLVSVLGGLTAVIMLVFKDTILGFVANIQLISNSMLNKGDWIEMPQYGANGEVTDITINTVKVQNWDKTITTIPTYSLISNAFKNWEGMSRSGGRRIKRSLYIDLNTIRFCTEKMLEKLKRFEHLKSYLETKQCEIAEHNHKAGIQTPDTLNGRHLTNIGSFRAYIVHYLRAHPMIHPDMTFLVRHLEPGPTGLPIQIYVFSKDQAWANYEAIQADIFDHLLAIVPEFGLRVFQNPTGADLASLARS